MSGGFMSYSSVSLASLFEKSERVYSVNLRGTRHFRFDYSANITNVRLRLGKREIYTGPPITTYDASAYASLPLTVVLQSTGNEFSIHVSDQCSFGSFIASL